MTMRASAVLVWLAAGTAAWAHDEKYSVSRIEIRDDGLVWKVDVALAGLEKVIRLPADPLDLTEEQLEGLKGDIVAYLRTCLRVDLNGRAAEAEAGGLEPLYESFVATGQRYIAHARQEFRFRSAAPVKRATLWGAFFRTKTDVHQAVLQVTWDGVTRSFSRVGAFELEITPGLIRPGFWNTGGEFFLGGLRRWLSGPPHIAFLLAILLAARVRAEAVRAVASYAVASGLMLLLSGLDRIRLSPAVTEGLIAASVVYVAGENYFLREARHRWVVTFAFGLVHGLGCSDVLRDRLRDLGATALPVAAYVLGVGAAEAAVTLVALPIFSWIRKAPDAPSAERRQRWFLRLASAPILGLGCLWTAQRLWSK